MKKIKKILIANRGEIAMRIMRTAHLQGIKTVAVFSEPDRGLPHVRYADEAVCIGPAAASESYLCGDKIINEAKRLNADAIHPGYGFLSENSTFAQAVIDAGLNFIGPSPKSIEIMGSKLGAKAAVTAFNVPKVPGTDEAVPNVKAAEEAAEKIGYPVLIKASAGGGGKGMRVANSSAELRQQFDRAVSEAVSSFGDGSVFIEKYVISPRHIEIQVIGDQHGNYVHLFERECSIQRRHQKVIEEAPSPVVTTEIRAKMGKAAVDVARSCNYFGAGTVEFIADKDLNFYFLEMNTRLQVEHPITEAITDIDLVSEQINIAEGNPLRFKQEDIELKGHAVEARIYAEDPSNNFLPDIGTLNTYRRPQGPNVRVDDGYEEGSEVTVHYDPMIAKLITRGPTREAARLRMITALKEYEVAGVITNIDFCKFVVNHPRFISGEYDTHFIDSEYDPKAIEKISDPESEEAAALIAAQVFLNEKNTQAVSLNNQTVNEKWKLRKRHS